MNKQRGIIDYPKSVVFANYLRASTYLEEIIILQKKCQELNLDFLVFKGIPLSIDLYGDIQSRMSCDIDCLINVDQYSDFFKMLKELGYRCYYSDDVDFDMSYIPRESQYPHVFPFCKKVRGIDVFIEVHLSITCEFRKCSYKVDFRKDIRVIKYKKTEITTLTHQLMFFHMINHYIKHLVNDLFNYYYNDSEVKNHDDKLIEITRYYNKYNEHISLMGIASLMKRLGKVNSLVLFDKMLSQLEFEPYFTNFVKFKSSGCSGHLQQLIDFLINYDYKICSQNAQKIMEEFFKSVKFSNSMEVKQATNYPFNKGPLPSELNAVYNINFDGKLNIKIEIAKKEIVNDLKFLFFIYVKQTAKMQHFLLKYDRLKNHIVLVDNNGSEVEIIEGNSNKFLDVFLSLKCKNIIGKIYFNIIITEQTSELYYLKELYANKSNNWLCFADYYYIEV